MVIQSCLPDFITSSDYNINLCVTELKSLHSSSLSLFRKAHCLLATPWRRSTCPLLLFFFFPSRFFLFRAVLKFTVKLNTGTLLLAVPTLGSPPWTSCTKWFTCYSWWTCQPTVHTQVCSWCHVPHCVGADVSWHLCTLHSSVTALEVLHTLPLHHLPPPSPWQPLMFYSQ